MLKFVKKICYLFASLASLVAGFMLFLSPVSFNIGEHVEEIAWGEVYFPEDGNGTYVPFIAFIALVVVGIVLLFLFFFPRLSRFLEVPVVAISGVSIGLLASTSAFYANAQLISSSMGGDIIYYSNGLGVVCGIALAALSLILVFFGSAIKR